MTEGLRWKTRQQINADLDRVMAAIDAEHFDTESPLYRAGYEAGYHAGYGDSEDDRAREIPA